MPLLKGRFDPKRFNSTMLGYELYEAKLDKKYSWNKLKEAEYREYVNLAQRVIDSLAAQKIIS
jgi:predicted NodU family carbamoyl transferase